MIQNSSSKGCWTCRDRKVRCDRLLPGCQVCIKSNRTCPGYGLRLSWPRENDKRRAIVPRDRQTLSLRVKQSQPFHFLNTGFWDVSLFDELSTVGVNNKHKDAWSLGPRMSVLPLGVGLDNREDALILYYRGVASRILTSINDSTNSFGDSLLRMAMSDNTPSSVAVYQGILAFTSLQLYGHGEGRASYSKALSALRASMDTAVGNKEGMQHLAASMLLGAYELCELSDHSANWTWYFCGSKTIVKTIYSKEKAYHGDEALLLNWVFYHDVLSKISIRHWPQRTQAMQACSDDCFIEDIQKSSLTRENIVGSAGCSLELLDAISQLVKINNSPDDELNLREERETSLTDLESWLKTLRQRFEVDGVDVPPNRRGMIEHIAELYRLAALVYVERVGRGACRYSRKVEKFLEDAFAILEKLDHCERPFPLFVIACEARTDAQRRLILDVLSKTKTARNSGNLQSTRTLIEAAWIQDDLHDEHELPTLAKYNAILGAFSGLPSFA